MRLSVDRGDVLSAMQGCIRAVAPRPQHAQLGHVLLAAETDLTVTCTDTFFAIRMEVPATVEEAGALTVPARLMLDFLQALAPGLVRMSTSQTLTLRLRSGANDAEIKGLDATLFPALPIPAALYARLDEAELSELIATTVYAASTDENRPVLTGVELSFEEESLRSVATDGFRLALCRRQVVRTPISGTRSVIAPARALAEARRLLSGSSAEVTLWLTRDERALVVRGTNFEVSTLLLAGPYQRIEGAVPQAFDVGATANREVLLDSLRVAALFAPPPHGAIDLTFDPNASLLRLNARSPEMGSHSAELTARVSGPAGKVRCNAGYLIDAVERVTGTEVQIDRATNERRFVVSDPTDGRALHVLGEIN